MKRILATILAVCLLMTAVPVIASAASATYTFTQLEGSYKTQGRVDRVGDTLYMDTTSSGFEFYFKGQGDVTLNADIKCTYTNNMFFTVIVDGVRSRVEVTNTASGTVYNRNITLATGLANGVHHIEVYKQTEASSALVTAKSVTLNGTLMAAPPADKLVMEVIGDSISGGTSSLCANGTANGSYPVYQDGTQTYAYFTGEALSANVRVTQTSGYGCVAGWNAQGRDLNLQDMFPYTCYWRDHTSAGLYDFTPAADIVVINLGTNDATSASKWNLTEAEFKAGAKNLMQMAQQKNPGAKVVWVTGMMGVKYQSVLTAAVSELGGAASGFFFTILPTDLSGGDGHPQVSGHKAAAETLTAFLLQNCLPASYKADFATASALQAKLTEAKAVTDPSAALKTAIEYAEAELTCGTTDGYRLGYRVQALEDAINGYVTGLSLMPVEGVTAAPNTNGHYVWPYYGNPPLVTLYKGGDGVYWPYLHTDYAVSVDLDDTPYLTMKTSGNAEWNVHVAYKDKNGNHVTVTATDLAGTGLVNFAPNAQATVLSVDLGAYAKAQGHTDANGCVTVVGCDLYIIGATDTFVTFEECALTSYTGEKLPTAITGGYAMTGEVLYGVEVGTTAEALCAAMDNTAYLRVTDANGNTVSGALKTGMTLQLVTDGKVADARVIAVTGDLNGDGVMSSVDAREILLSVLGSKTLTAVKKQAADMDGNASATTNDVRLILKAALG